MKISIFILILFFYSCSSDQNDDVFIKPILSKNIDDQNFIINKEFLKGDSRRYGIYPNKSINQTLFKKLITLADLGQPIFFSKGIYNTNIQLIGVTDIEFTFKDAIVTGLVNIIERDSIASNRIEFKGNITILDKLFIRKSKNIIFNSIQVISDTIVNISNKKNRGVSIYTETENVFFNNLKISDTGVQDEKYFIHTKASLQIQSYNNSPKNVRIENLVIDNSAGTAFLLMGDKHFIKKAAITNFGLRKYVNSKKTVSGIWIKNCNFCEIDSIIIDHNHHTFNKDIYSLNLGNGISSKPSFIHNISLKNNAKLMEINDSKLTNILVKNEF